jgi:hypothetical protein
LFQGYWFQYRSLSSPCWRTLWSLS